MRNVNGSVALYYGATANAAVYTDLLQSAAMQAHGAVRARRHEQGFRGTTATTLTLHIDVWPTDYLPQVEDSRDYAYRNGKLS